jgi:hypothetical protein
MKSVDLYPPINWTYSLTIPLDCTLDSIYTVPDQLTSDMNVAKTWPMKDK